MSRHLSFLCIVIVGLQGCASLSQDECLTADWHTIGYEDGLNGRQPVRIADHRKSCAKHGVAPDLARYEQGRQAGLKQYCVPQKGFNLGVSGQRYNGVCPADAEPGFLQAYSEGKQIYEVKTQIRRLDEILRVNESELASLKESMREKQTELVMQGTTPRRRAILLLELKELHDTVQMVEAEIIEIEEARRQENNHLASLKQSSGRW
jgi:hypothetical protein